MPNLLLQAAELLQQRMERDAGVVVMYHRPGSNPFPVYAVPGRTVVMDDSTHGFVIRIVTKDFTIRAALLKAQGVNSPNRNDKITVKVGEEEQEFLVNGDANSSHYEDADAYGVSWRIHTKRDVVNA